MRDATIERKAGAERPYDALAEAKQLVRVVRAGALATLAPGGEGPFASLVNVASAPDGSPILLMSRLAAHTRHIEADNRMSLLLALGGPGDPLTHPRLTLSGRAVRVVDPNARAALRSRFLAKHPQSELYADFADFSFFLVAGEHAHLNGGFARAGSFKWAMVRTPVEGAEELIAGEAEALAHLNNERQDALALYATAVAGRPAGDWRASGLDPEGLDLACADETARIAFSAPIHDLATLRATLAALTADARHLAATLEP